MSYQYHIFLLIYLNKTSFLILSAYTRRSWDSLPRHGMLAASFAVALNSCICCSDSGCVQLEFEKSTEAVATHTSIDRTLSKLLCRIGHSNELGQKC